MKVEDLSTIIIRDFVEEKIKEESSILNIEENELLELLGDDIDKIIKYIDEKINKNLSLEAFNKSNIEKSFYEALNLIMENNIKNIQRNINDENLLISKIKELSTKNDPKSLLYYLFLKKLLNKTENKYNQNNIERREVIIG